MATRTISTKLAIEGESEYRAAMSRINTELKTLQSNLKLTESQYQTNANSMEALKAKGDALTSLYEAQKSKVDTLKTALENAKTAHDNFAQKSEELKAKIQANSEALEKLRATTGDTTAEEQKLIKENEALNAELSKNEQYAAAAEKGVNAWQTQLNKAQIDLNNLDAELKQNDALLDEAKNSSDGCAHSIDEFGNKVKESADATDRQNEALDALSAALAAGGVVAGIDKIKDALMACVEASAAFEAGMSAVGAIANASAEEMDLLSEKAQQIGASTKFTAGEAASAMEYMALAGWSAEEMLEGIDGVINLAAASGENLATVSDIVTDALTAFGLKAGDSEHFVDVLAKTAASSNTTVTMLGEAFKYAAPLAGALGYSVEDVAVAMGLMANQGIKGSQAGTAMRTMFTKLAGDITLSADAFGKVTLSAANADGTMKPLSQSLEELRYYFGQMTQAEKLANAEAVAGKYAMSGLTALMNTTQEDFDSLTKSIQDCTGAAETMAKTRMDNLQGQVTLMKSAFDALKIAIGDDLNPALRGLAETGTDVLTWAADFINKHEEIVPVVTAVVAGLTTLTGTIAAYTLAKKAVIPVITAFNAALDANPALLAATAIVTLTAALVTLAATMPEDEYKSLTAASKDQYDHLQELNAEYERACELYGENSEEARKLAGQIEAETALFDKNRASIEQVSAKTNELIERQKELKQNSAETESSIERQRGSSEYLLGKLQELMSEEEKSAGTKRQILAVVDLLNEEIPNLGLAYDEYTDSLNLNAAAIQDVIDKEIEREKLAANYDELKQEMVLQKDLTEQYATVTDNLTAARRRLTEAEEAYENATVDSDYGRLYSISEYLLALQAAEDEVEQLEDQESKLSSALEENSEKVDDLTDSYEDLTEGVKESVDYASMAAGSLKGSLEELAAAYIDAYEEAKKSFDGQFGLWEEAPEVTAKSVEDMLNAQQSQLDWWEDYSDNLDALLDRNVEGVDRLAANFADGSEESAAALQGLAGATDEEIAKIISTMDQVSAARESLAGNFAEVKTNLTGEISHMATEYETAVQQMNQSSEAVDFGPFVSAVQEAFGEAGAIFETVGGDAAQGLKNGIEISSGDVLLAADTMGKGVIDALKTALDSHSPSRKTEKIGQDADDGLKQGVESHADQVIRAVEDLGKQIVEKLSDVGRTSVEGFDAEFEALDDHIHQTMEEARAVVNEYGWTLNAEMQSIGSQMIDGMVDGLYGQSGSLYSAIWNIVSEAIEEARRAADTHSPSKKTEKIFEDVGEGMVVGIEKKRARVADATQDVVDNALTVDTSGMIEAARLLSKRTPDLTPLLSRGGASAASAGSGDISVTVNMPGMVVREEADIEKISQAMAKQVAFALRQKGR